MTGAWPIVVEPGLGEFDAEGRYRSHALARLSDVLDVRAIAHDYAAHHGRPLAELLTNMCAAARACTCMLLAYLQVIGEASQVTRIAFLGDSREVAAGESETTSATVVGECLFADLRRAAECYNRLAAQVARWREEIRGPRLPRFELAELEPDETTLAVSRERIALGNRRGGLGANWWREVGDG